MKALHPLILAGALAACGAAIAANSDVPQFEATSLTGETVSSDQLVGQPTVLIVTPSRGASEGTRKWVAALRNMRSNVDAEQVRVRDVLALDLPFFISESYALERAREEVPRKYHDQTWLLDEPVLERALGIPPGSEQAHVVVLNSSGEVQTMVRGNPTDRRINEVQTAVRQLPATSGGQGS